MDSFELNKIFGALTGALAVFLGIGFVVNAMFGGGHHHGHHGHQTLAFAVAIDDGGAAEEVVEEEIPFQVVLAAADPALGERLFRGCQGCHSIEEGGANGTGPALWGVVGRPIGGHDGFGYSETLAGLDGVWDWDALNGFIEAPGDWAPGTSMGYRGMDDVEDRANLIAYLAQQASDPVPLPSADEAALVD